MTTLHEWYFGTKPKDPRVKDPRVKDEALKPRRMVEKPPVKKQEFDSSIRDGKGKKYASSTNEAIAFLLSACSAPLDIESDTCKQRIRTAISRTSKDAVIAFYTFMKSLEDTNQNADDTDEEDENIDMALVHRIVNEIVNERDDVGDGLSGLFDRL
jgi:hypothetical protein